MMTNSWLAARKPKICKPAKTCPVQLGRLGLVDVETCSSVLHKRWAWACTKVMHRFMQLGAFLPLDAQKRQQPHLTLKISKLMSEPSSSQFPSGIPDPPIFQKLGPKDRSLLRRNIETKHADNMTTEQTYVHRGGGIEVELVV
jgi:hypothetical protein